ncbi:MAG: hypothetical protein Q9M89_09240 [Persephonella sp.]|nr:hypothetical protein [Persephonella sp.]
MKTLTLKKGKVVKAYGSKGDFTVETANGETFQSEYLVIATGFHKFDIEGLDVGGNSPQKISTTRR